MSGANLPPPEAPALEIPKLSAEALIEAGFHFGHRSSRWDPRMREYIRDKKNGIHIIDLKKSVRELIRAKHFLKNLTSTGVRVCFVGTKKQAKDVVRQEALRCSQAFVSERWLGGTLTNFSTIRKRLARLDKLDTLKSTGEFAKMPKKMQARVNREHRKILGNLEGLRALTTLPSALIVIDAKHEATAIEEAHKLDVPVIAIVDTDSNPEKVDIVIPGNDDSMRGLQIMVHELAEACIEGAKLHQAGRGLTMKAELEVRPQDEGGPSRRDGQRRDRGDRGTRGPRGPRIPRRGPEPEASRETEAAAAEAVEQAEAQGEPAPAPTVRTKPRAQPKKAEEPAAEGQAPAGDAPKADA